MLNQPYGWGDMYGEQDCSRFLQMVFATVGISLPRDSKDQAQVSNSVVDFDEKSDDTYQDRGHCQGPCGQHPFGHEGAYHALFRDGRWKALCHP